MSCSLIWAQAIRLSEETAIFRKSSPLGTKTHIDFPCYSFPLRILCAFTLSFLFSLLGLNHIEWILLFFFLGVAWSWKHQNKDTIVVQTLLFLKLYLSCSSLASLSFRSKKFGGDTYQFHPISLGFVACSVDLPTKNVSGVKAEWGNNMDRYLY